LCPRSERLSLARSGEIEVTIPDYANLHRFNDVWTFRRSGSHSAYLPWTARDSNGRVVELSDEHKPGPSTIVYDDKVREKLGIERGSHVLAVSGGLDRFMHLPDETRFDYTDVSPEVVEFMKRLRIWPRIHSFKQEDALRLPAGKCDYVLMHDPVYYNALPVTLLRSLVHARKGVKIVYSPSTDMRRCLSVSERWRGISKKQWAELEGVNQLLAPYLKADVRDVDLKFVCSADSNWGDAMDFYEGPHRLVTITPTKSARRKAQLDLELMGLLQKQKSFRVRVQTLANQPRIKKLGASVGEVKKALARINHVCQLCSRDFDVVWGSPVIQQLVSLR